MSSRRRDGGSGGPLRASGHGRASGRRRPCGGHMRNGHPTVRKLSLRIPRKHRVRNTLITAAAMSLVTTAIVIGTHNAQAAVGFEIRSLDGTGNNVANPTWGQAGTAYSRVAAA